MPDSALVERTVLVIWHSESMPEVMQPIIERLRARVGEKGSVRLENADRFENGKKKKS